MKENYSFFEVEEIEQGRIISIKFNRPKYGNAFNEKFWEEFPKLISEIEQDTYSVVLLSSTGQNFCFGLDLSFLSNSGLIEIDNFNKRKDLLNLIQNLQKSFVDIYKSEKIYISCINGACIGAGLDLISACDLRVASQSSYVSLRETKVGIVADLGSLYFLPKIIGLANTKYMAFTAKNFTAVECYQMGLFQSIFETDEGMMSAGIDLARCISENSGFVLTGVKKNIHYGIEHSIDDAMDFVSVWNTAFLNNPELHRVIDKFMGK